MDLSATTNRKKRVLLGLTGSVASIKIIRLTQELLKNFEVKIIVTNNASHFITRTVQEAIARSSNNSMATVDNVNNNNNNITVAEDDHHHHHQEMTLFEFFRNMGVSVHTDKDEWDQWNKMDDPVLHIELRRWADLFLIAPLSANTLAKLANGISDNLLTCVARAWDFTVEKRPMLVAPAMNTLMWDHPFTEKHLNVLRNELRIQVIPPIAKKLACGDVGLGAMAEVDTIVNAVKDALLL